MAILYVLEREIDITACVCVCDGCEYVLKNPEDPDDIFKDPYDLVYAMQDHHMTVVGDKVYCEGCLVKKRGKQVPSREHLEYIT